MSATVNDASTVPNSNKLNQISNQSSPNPIDKLSKMDQKDHPQDHHHNYEMENKSAKVHVEQVQEKTHEKTNKVHDGKKFDRSHDNPEYENHLKFQNHTGQGFLDGSRRTVRTKPMRAEPKGRPGIRGQSGNPKERQSKT